MGSTVKHGKTPNSVADSARQEFRDIVALDHTRFDLDPTHGNVRGNIPGRIGSLVDHSVEAAYTGNEEQGTLSTVKRLDTSEGEWTLYQETIFDKGRVTTLEYPALGYDSPTALITTVEKKNFGWTEELTTQELDDNDFLQWEIADARNKL